MSAFLLFCIIKYSVMVVVVFIDEKRIEKNLGVDGLKIILKSKLKPIMIYVAVVLDQ